MTRIIDEDMARAVMEDGEYPFVAVWHWTENSKCE